MDVSHVSFENRNIKSSAPYLSPNPGSQKGYRIKLISIGITENDKFPQLNWPEMTWSYFLHSKDAGTVPLSDNDNFFIDVM